MRSILNQLFSVYTSNLDLYKTIWSPQTLFLSHLLCHYLQITMSCENIAPTTPPNSASTLGSANPVLDAPTTVTSAHYEENIRQFTDYYYRMFLADVAAQEAINFQRAEIDTFVYVPHAPDTIEEIESPEYEEPPFTPTARDLELFREFDFLWAHVTFLMYDDDKDDQLIDSDDELSLFEEVPKVCTAATEL